MSDATPRGGDSSLRHVSLRFAIERGARLEGLVGSGGRGYSRPDRHDRVARAVFGCGALETRVGVERVDHSTVKAAAVRIRDGEPWGWAEARLALDEVMSDLHLAGLLAEPESPPPGRERMTLHAMSLGFDLRAVPLARDPASFGVPDSLAEGVGAALHGIAAGAHDVAVRGRTAAGWDGALRCDFAFAASSFGAWRRARVAVDLACENLARLGLHEQLREQREWLAARLAALAAEAA